MQMQVTLSNVKKLAERVWEVSLVPRDVRRLGEGADGTGATSVLLLSTSPRFDGTALEFSADDAKVLNVGGTDRAIIIDATAPKTFLERFARKQLPTRPSKGDQAFLDRLEALPEEVRNAGKKLLADIRVHFPGELKPVSDCRFQETPDNFWFVTVQPRAESILVTVRGLPDRFQPCSLKVLVDRRPYSRFKVRSLNDVPDAVGIVRQAIRRRAK